MPTTALIVAAGSGVRMGSPSPKAFVDLAGRPLLEHSLASLDAHSRVDSIVLMAPAGMLAAASGIAHRYRKVAAVVAGGKRRQDTVRLGLARILETRLAAGGGPGDLVLVHDAARPLVEARLIEAVLDAAERTGAAVPGITPSDTVKEISQGGGSAGPRMATATLRRGGLVLVQTPQAFRLDLLREAYERSDETEMTDDAALVELLGHPVEVVPGSHRNLKVTAPEDLILAEAMLKAADRPGGGR